MEKRSDETIFDYARTIQEKYPDLTPNEIYEICRTPFRLAALEMKSGSLKDVRIKYLGTFCVFPGRVKGVLNSISKAHAAHKVDDQYLANCQAKHDNYFKMHKDGKSTLDETD